MRLTKDMQRELIRFALIAFWSMLAVVPSVYAQENAISTGGEIELRALSFVDSVPVGTRHALAYEARNLTDRALQVRATCRTEGELGECTTRSRSFTIPAGKTRVFTARYDAGDRAGEIGGVYFMLASGNLSVEVYTVVITKESGQAAANPPGGGVSIAMLTTDIEIWFALDSANASANSNQEHAFYFVENNTSNSVQVDLSCSRAGAVSGCTPDIT
jgi:hypothetical protein